ncbi:MAG: carboxypeptidase regulatory-like domain-containing protein [Planctomycetes bacterium]|nr:carboxypeptidase regulatory-like domain-containing protein [Planctomycetota bacterium]
MSRSVPSLVAVCSLLLLGTLAFFLLRAPAGPDATSQPAAMPVAASSGNAAAAPRAELDAPSSPDPTPGERTAAAAAPELAVENPAASAARAGNPATKLTGVVMSSAGAPVEGALVSARPSGGGFEFELPLELGDGGARAAGRRSEATTDAQGRFELSGLRPGQQSLEVRAPRFARLQTRDVRAVEGVATDVGTLVLELGGVLTGVVVDRRGAPVAEARVLQLLESLGGGLMIVGGAPGVELARSGVDGSFRIDTLPAGPFRLRVTHEAHPDQATSGEVASPGQVLAPVSIVLDDGFTIAGRVVGLPASAGEHLVRASPKREGAGAIADFDFDLGAGVGGESRSGKLRADGSFEIRGLRENQLYVLGLRKSARPGSGEFDFGQRLSSRVEARAGERGVELQYRPESTIVAQVIDAATRKPIEELELSAGVGFAMPVAADGRGRKSWPEGRIRAANLRPRRAEDRATLKLEAVGYRTYERNDIALREGEVVDLGVIELQAAPMVVVQVLDDATGAPLEGASVTLRVTPEASERGAFVARTISIEASAGEEPDFDFGGESTRVARTDAEGLARLSSFEGKRCSVLASHARFAPSTSAEFVGTPDASPLTLRLRKGGGALVKLIDAAGAPVAGARIERRAAGDAEALGPFGPAGSSSEVTDAAGVARFERLAPGVHEFRPAPSGGGVMMGGDIAVFAGMSESEESAWGSVEVREAEFSELTLRAPLKVLVSGVVSEAGEPLVGASVSLDRRPADGAPRMPRLPFGGGPRAKTDSRGAYELKDVAPGDYILTVEHRSRAMPTELDVVVLERDTRRDVALSIATIEGRVLDSDGRALAGVRVRVERADEEGGPRAVFSIALGSTDGGVESIGEFGGPESVKTDSDGRYALRGVSTGVKLEVHAEAKGLQPARSEAFELSENELKSGVNLKLEQAGSAEVSVFRADGTPAQMVIVTATPEGEIAKSAERKTEFIQESGKALLDGLAPGTWRIAVRPVGLGGGGANGATAEPQAVVVKPGVAANVRFDLP